MSDKVTGILHPGEMGAAVGRCLTGRGLYVDANAISPATAGEVARVIEDGGGSYVDGGIIGPPPVSAGTTRLYLSGSRAEEVAGLFAGSALAAPVLAAAGHGASALKLAPMPLGPRALPRSCSPPGPSPGRKGSRMTCWRSGRCPSRGWRSGGRARRVRPPAKAGAGWRRWRRSPPP